MRFRIIVLTVAVALGAGASALTVGVTRGSFGGCGLPERSDCVRVLFIGNSYTSVNDLPGTFAGLARSAGFAVDSSAIDPGGQTLAGHLADPSVTAAITSGRWNVVVLQEQSEIPAASDAVAATMTPAVSSLVRTIRSSHAAPFLLETWAHRDGWPDRGLDRAAMQAAIDASYEAIGSSLGVPVAPVGRAWQRATADAPSIVLWQDDGSHPTSAGTYLAAAVLLRTVTGRSAVGLSAVGALATTDAEALQRIAAETIP